MRRHVNPYRINDPTNIFEVAENSSHPELYDKRRIYDYKGHRFTSAEKCQTFLESHGIDWRRRCKLVPVRQLDGDGSCIIVCHIAERVPEGHMDIREYERMSRHG